MSIVLIMQLSVDIIENNTLLQIELLSGNSKSLGLMHLKFHLNWRSSPRLLFSHCGY